MKENILLHGHKHTLILDEATRRELLNKSKTADNYKDTSKGKNRYDRRVLSHIPNQVRNFNKLDMDSFFKKDELKVTIDVQGETDNYVVLISFKNALKEIAREIKINKGKLEFRVVLQSLLRTFNTGDVYLHCQCPDFKYTFDYWSTKNKYNAGPLQYDPGKGIRNPTDSKGSLCKHGLLVIANMDWMMKVASVVNNYINYAKENMENLYAKYIFPKLYGKKYDRAVQMSIDDYDEQGNERDDLRTRTSDIDAANRDAIERVRFKKGGKQGIRFAKEEPEEDEKQLHFDVKIPGEEKRLRVPEEEEKRERTSSDLTNKK